MESNQSDGDQNLATTDLREILNAFLDRLGSGQARIISDLSVRMEESAQRGTSAGMAEAVAVVAELLQYVRDGSLRESIVQPIRSQAVTAVHDAVKSTNHQARTSIIEVRDDARRVIHKAVPRIAVPWLIVGMLAMLALETVAAVLGVKAISGSTFDSGFAAGARERMLRESAFYSSLDTMDQATLTRHNARLDQSLRLNFPKVLQR